MSQCPGWATFVNFLPISWIWVSSSDAFALHNRCLEEDKWGMCGGCHVVLYLLDNLRCVTGYLEILVSPEKMAIATSFPHIHKGFVKVKVRRRLSEVKHLAHRRQDINSLVAVLVLMTSWICLSCRKSNRREYGWKLTRSSWGERDFWFPSHWVLCCKKRKRVPLDVQRHGVEQANLYLHTAFCRETQQNPVCV